MLNNSLPPISEPHTWRVTGSAGVIDSNLLEALLTLNPKVITLDKLTTGHHANLKDVQ